MKKLLSIILLLISIGVNAQIKSNTDSILNVFNSRILNIENIKPFKLGTGFTSKNDFVNVNFDSANLKLLNRIITLEAASTNLNNTVISQGSLITALANRIAILEADKIAKDSKQIMNDSRFTLIESWIKKPL
jgi:hypothetical protein